MVKTEKKDMEPVQLSGRFEGEHFIGRWRFDGSPFWFDFEFEKDNESFKGYFQLRNKNGVTKIPETLTLTNFEGDQFVGTGSNVFGEFQLWGKRDEKTNLFEGFKKYTSFHETERPKKSLKRKLNNGKSARKKKIKKSKKRNGEGSSEEEYEDGFIEESEEELEDVIVKQEDTEQGIKSRVGNNEISENIPPLTSPDSTILGTSRPSSSIDTASQNSINKPEKPEMPSTATLPDISVTINKLPQISPPSTISPSQHITYVVRLIKPENGEEKSTRKGRARRKIRNFVIGLQSRHFFPYDPNDYTLGPPPTHPLRTKIQILKVNSRKKNKLNPPTNGNGSSNITTPQLNISSIPSNPNEGSMRSEVDPFSPELFRYPCTTPRILTQFTKIVSNSTKPDYFPTMYELDGSCYEGETFEGLRHGYGVAGYWNGCLYIGQFRKGLEQGIGELRDPSGCLIYRGEFEHGKICGLGTFYYSDGSVYRGEMREGEKHGKGIIWYNDGSVYEGDFVHGQRSGNGTFLCSDGSNYSGEWASDLRNGKGILKLEDGTTLDGLFKENYADGKGYVSFASDGSSYEGNFKDGLKDGRGTYTFGGNIAFYQGRFARDTIMINSVGTLKMNPTACIELPCPDDPKQSEWMRPIEDLQAGEMSAVHLKAGFEKDGS